MKDNGQVASKESGIVRSHPGRLTSTPPQKSADKDEEYTNETWKLISTLQPSLSAPPTPGPGVLYCVKGYRLIPIPRANACTDRRLGARIPAAGLPPAALICGGANFAARQHPRRGGAQQDVAPAVQA